MINFRLIRHLWLFLAVAEEQHFGRAAKRLNMSQPPLTEQIQVLEQALKVKLFERSTKGAKLTAAGAAMLPAVRKFAEQMERLELSVREAVAGRTGVLSVGTITSAMLDVVPEVLEGLRRDHPGLSVAVQEMDSAEAVTALETGDIDLGFVRLQGDWGDVRSIPLAEDRLAVALPRAHRLAESTRIPLADLTDEEFVMFARRVSPVYYDSIIASCKDAGFLPRTPHEVRSVASQIAFVSCGQGVALVPSGFKRLAPENVVVRPLKEAITIVTAAIAWNTKRETELVKDAVKIATSRKPATPKRARRVSASR